jgi:hypothetical protein
MILPWDADRLERDARRADTEMIGSAGRPYDRAISDVRGSLLGTARAANPTRGAAATRGAMIAAAPEIGRLAGERAEAINAARSTATANANERARARAEDASRLLGMGLTAGGSVLGTLTGALGGMGGGPGAAPAGGAGGFGGLVGAAAPIAGMAAGGPLGGMAGGMIGSALTQQPRMASSLAGPAPALPAVERFNPFAGMAPAPAATPAPAPAPAPVAPAPVAPAMSDAEWAAADEEARRLRARLGY